MRIMLLTLILNLGMAAGTVVPPQPPPSVIDGGSSFFDNEELEKLAEIQ